MIYRRMRRLLSRVRPLRSAWYLFRDLKQMAVDSSERTDAECEQTFAARVDPWNYHRPEEQERHRRAAKILDQVRSAEPFHRAWEVGCAEGTFTELLAPRCENLLAVDISPIALARAQGRKDWSCRVAFRRWNLRTDQLPGCFDLIVAMDVLSYLNRPSLLRAAREKLVAALEPGGYLLVGDTCQGEPYESAWWARWLIRDGKWITAFMGKHPALETVATSRGDFYALSLLKKVACAVGKN